MQAAEGGVVPPAGPRLCGEVGDLADQGEGERERVLGDLVDAEVGDVGDDDAEAGGVFHRDVVEADAVAPDDQAIRRRIEHGGRDALPTRQYRGAVRGEPDELVLLAGLGGGDLGADCAEYLPLDVKGRPCVIGYENFHWSPRKAV